MIVGVGVWNVDENPRQHLTPKKYVEKLEIPKVIETFRKKESVYGAWRTMQSKIREKCRWKCSFSFFKEKVKEFGPDMIKNSELR